MKRVMQTLVLALLVLPLASYAMGPDHQFETGVQFQLPYIVDAGDIPGGAAIEDETGDVLLGVFGNWFYNANWSFGAQFDIGLEKPAGGDTQFLITPGTAWNFLPDAMFDPYVRLDVPFNITGGVIDDFDVGVNGGVGVVWHLEDLTGVEGFSFKTDFDANYFFDSELFSLTLFRAALAYSF